VNKSQSPWSFFNHRTFVRWGHRFIQASLFQVPESPWAVSRRYVLTIAIAAGATLVRYSFDPLLGKSGFAVSLIGMIAAAWVGGLGPGLISQTLILFTHAAFFPSARPAPPVGSAEGIISLLAFYSVGGCVALLSEAWRASRHRAHSHAGEALRQEQQFRTALTCMADAVIVTDASGRVTIMNRAAEAMTGWNSCELIGKPLQDAIIVCDPVSLEIMAHPLQRAIRDDAVVHEPLALLATARHEHRQPVSLSAAPVHDSTDRLSGSVLVLRDEAQRLAAERALREADRRKDEFLATLGHELRNPLAPICMGLELLKSSTDRSETMAQVRSMMERQTQHMVRLIDDLLDVSRITRGKLVLQCSPVAISEVVQSAVEMVLPALKSANHHLQVHLPEHELRLFADRSRLTQVLVNLLDNAIRYTPPGGQIAVAAELTNSEATLTVTDSGRGIAEEKLDEIFEMFMQLRSPMEHGHQGLGIGLTLVKQLVRMHGGSIEAFSSGTGKGSRFQIRMPVMSGTSRTVADLFKPEMTTAQGGLRVLVVDDISDARKTLSMLVRVLGYEVHEAADGAEALNIAEAIRPDVILMDLGMPNMNGFEAARALRERPWTHGMLLVATTGWGQEDDRRRTAEAGFDEHLVKPIDVAALRKVLSSRAPDCNRTEKDGRGEGDLIPMANGSRQ
jgi:PAS domain S-box-containing protein